jgi:hypothetical protein
MNGSFRKLLRWIGIPLGLALIVYLAWDGSKGLSAAGILAGISLLAVAAAMLSIKQMEVTSEKNIRQRIRSEVQPESQARVVQVYEHLKGKELEGLFAKILDDAHGDANAIQRLSGLAESIGWKAFLENKW